MLLAREGIICHKNTMMTLCVDWRVVRFFQGEEKINKPILYGLGILGGVHITKPYVVFFSCGILS
jgi:hypothetical protein